MKRQVSLTLSEGMVRATNEWRNGNHSEASDICKAILAVRPNYQGAKHLLWAIDKNVKGLVFTSIVLHDPIVFDIGEFSYGVPQVFQHNQAHEPARLIVGKYCTIGHDVSIYLGAYHRQDTYTIYPFSAPHLGELFPLTKHIKDYSCTRGGVTIGNDVWIGAHSIILSGVCIGNGAVIGAGSVVSRDVGPYEIWAGNPAVFRGRRFDVTVANRLLRLSWWNWSKSEVESNARDIMSSSEDALTRLEVVADKQLPSGDGVDFYVRGLSSTLRVRKQGCWQDGRAIYVVLHGSLGAIESVIGIAPHLANFNCLFIDLPGCGHSSLPAEMSVNGFAAELLPAIQSLVPEDYIILGVSFGGAVGLQLAHLDKCCKGVVLVDTPLSAQKQWHNHLFLRNKIAQHPDNQYIRRFALEIYGVTEHAAVERDYWFLLAGVEIPIVVVTGDVQLLPVRSLPPVPCCLEETDLIRLEDSGAQVYRITGGHDLINENPIGVAEAAINAIKKMLD